MTRPGDSLDELPADLALSPSAVSSYLGSAGWDLEAADEAAAVWGLSEGRGTRARLLLPLDRSYADFAPRFQEALRTLRLVHDWDLQQLATHVLGARSDFLFVRADQSTPDGTIPLRQAQSLLDGAQQLLLYAACSAIRPRSTYGSGRRPKEASNFLNDDVRMGHTQRGSFVITVLTRLDADDTVIVEPDANELIAPGASDAGAHTAGEVAAIIPPFQRRVMATLATALELTHQAVQTGASGRLERAVERGVSANLVDALAGMTSYEGLHSLDLSFQWAPAEPVPPPATEHVLITREEMPRLAAAANLLRQVPDVVRDSITGQVIRLERAETDEGIITIEGTVGRSTRRKVRVDLNGEPYDTAIRAHRQRLPVTATGDITKRGRDYWLLGDVSFNLVGPQDLR